MKKVKNLFILFVLLSTTSVFQLHAQASGTPLLLTFAGNDTARYSGDGGQATAASFNNPIAITKDIYGNYYVADKGNHVVRKISPTGIISTFAGTGTYGYTGASGVTPTSTPLMSPVAVCSDAYGNIYIADEDAGVVRIVSHSSGNISTYAGGGSVTTNGVHAYVFQLIKPQGLAIDNSGNLYISDAGTHQIYYVDYSASNIHFVTGKYGISGYSGDGGLDTGAYINNPRGITLDVANNIYFCDSGSGNFIVRKINSSGIITTIINSGLNNPWGIGVDSLYNLYISNASGNTVVEAAAPTYSSVIPFAGNGASGYTSSLLNIGKADTSKIYKPLGIYVQSTSKLFFADSGNRVIRKVQRNSIPYFSHGTTKTVNVCQNSVNNNLDTLLNIIDLDQNQTESWSVSTYPSNGTLSGFGVIAATSIGGVLVFPDTATYTPNFGTISDSFKIKVFDGFDSSSIIIHINALGTPTTKKINGDSMLCVGSTLSLNDSLSGGNWYSTHLGIATIAINGTILGSVDYGVVYGASAGTDTLIYTITNGCFYASSSKAVTVVGSTPAIHALKNGSAVIGLGCQTTFTTVDSGGSWSHTNSAIATINPYGVNSSELLVYGNNFGVDTIKYSLYNVCGTSKADTVIHIENTHAGTIYGPTSVCTNATITLIDSVAGGYWHSSDTTKAKVDSVLGIVTGKSSGSVIIKYKILNNCSGLLADSVSKTIIINTAPVNTPIVGDSFICVGSTKTYTDATFFGSWSVSNSSLATVNTSGIVIGLDTGMVNLFYTKTNISLCSVTETLNVIIKPLPYAGTVTVPSTFICKNAVIPLSSSVLGGTWACSNARAVIRSTDSLAAISAGVVKVFYTFTNVCGSATDSVNITIDSLLLPVVTPTSLNPLTIKENCSATYTTPVPTGGTWTITNPLLVYLPSTAAGNIITDSTPGADTISYIVTNACGSTSVSGIINITPTLTAGIIVGDSSLCVGTTHTYNNYATGGTWSLTNTALATISTSGNITALASGTDTIIYSNTLSCGSAATTKIINIKSIPHISPIQGDSIGCFGTAYTLTDSISGGTWGIINNNSTPATISFSTGLILSAIQGDIYVIYSIISSTNSCSASDTFHIRIDSTKFSPGVISGPNAICLGTPFILTESIKNGRWDTAASINNYFIYTNDSAVALFNYFSGLDTIKYIVTNGCGDSMTSKVLTINAIVTAFSQPISGSNSICIGTSTQLLDTTAVVDSFSSPSWISSNPSVATISATGLLTGLSAGIDTIIYQISNTCGIDTVQKVITITSLPNAGQIIGDSILCFTGSPTDSIPLTDSIVGGIWSSTNPAVAMISATGEFYPVATGTVIISYTNNNGCGSSVTTKTFSLYPFSSSGTISGSNNVCAGYIVTLTDTSSGGTWSVSNSHASVLGGIVSGFSPGIDTIIYSLPSSSYGCSAAATKVITVSGVNTTSIITTVAGNGIGSFAGDGGQATVAELDAPTAVALDNAGNIYISDKWNNRIRKINNLGIIFTIAGNGTAGFSGDEGQATAAQLNGPEGIAIDSIGDIYFSDQENNRVRKIDTFGIISTIAGKDTGSFSGDGGAATSAALFYPSGIKLDNQGNIYIADKYNNRIRKINSSGIINTIAGIGTSGFSGDGGAATAAELNDINGIAIDNQGNVYIADAGNQRVRKINTIGIISTIAGNGIAGYTADGIPATASELFGPGGVSIDNQGNIYISDFNNNRIRKINSAGIISTFTGNGTYGFSGDMGSASAAQLAYPSAVTLDSYGNLYIADLNNSRIRKVMPPDTLQSISGNQTVCVGSHVTLIDSTVGGIWSASNSYATISTSGVVTGVSAGVDTVSYTLVNSCGMAIITKVITVNPIPNALPITGFSTVCTGSTIMLMDPSSGGVWSSSNISVATVSGTGLVTGIAGGTTTISYTINNVCGSSIKSTTIIVNASVSSIGVISGNSSICLGSQTTLSESMSGGSWGVTNTNASISNLGVVTGVSVGVDTILYVIYNICGADTATKVININSLPITATVSGPSTVCVGSSINLSSTIIGGFWSSSNSNVNISSTGSVTGIMAGTATIYYTSTTECGSAVASYNITILPVPNAGIISGGTSVCIGTPLYLSASALGGAFSTGNALLAVSSGGVVTGITAGIGIVSYTVSNGCGVASTFQYVYVNPASDAGVISGSATVCAGTSTLLSNAASSGSWSASNSNVSVVGGWVSGLSQGTAFISYTVANSCGTSYTTFPITILGSPLAASITGATTLCAGTSITLNASSTGGSWSSLSSNASVSTSGVVTSVSGGEIIINYIVNNSCGSAIASYNIIATPMPDAGVISGSNTVCLGFPTFLTNSASGGFWYSGNGNASISGGLVTGLYPGTDTIYYLDSNACGISRAQLGITVLPNLGAGTINGPAIVCSSNPITLTDSVSGGYWASNSGYTTVNNGVVTFGSFVGTETIIYTVSNYCGTATAFFTLQIGQTPNPGTITGSNLVCTGYPNYLTDLITGGSWWSTNTAVVTVNNGIITGINPGSADILYTVSSGICGADTSFFPVTVSTGANAGAITGSGIVCIGTPSTFTDSIPYGVWSVTNNNAVIDSTGVVYGLQQGWDTINYTILNSCGLNVATFVIAIYPMPNAGSISGSSIVCLGSTLALNTSATFGYWSSTNNSASISPSGIITGIFPGQDTINYIDSNGCGVAAAIFPIQIASSPSAGGIIGLDAVCVNSSINLADTGSSAMGFWYSSNGNITIDSAGKVTGLHSGISTVYYRVSNGFCADTAKYIVNINAIPVLKPIIGPNFVCLGTKATVYDSSLSGTWSTQNANATINDSGIVTGNVVGADTINYIYTNACGLMQQTLSISIHQLPTPVGSIIGDSILCVNLSLTLSNDSTGGVWINKDSNLVSIQPLATNCIINGLKQGKDTIYYSKGNVCGMVLSQKIISVRTIPNEGKIIGLSHLALDSTTTLSETISDGIWSIIQDSENVATITPITGILTANNYGQAIINYALSNTCGNANATLTLNVTSPDTMSTIAGNGKQGYFGDGLPADTCEIDQPQDVAIDQYGRIFFTDANNNRIRMIDTSGIVTTIAGGYGSTHRNGTDAKNGDGGLATHVILSNPQYLAINNNTGEIIFSDAGHNTLRKLRPGGGGGRDGDNYIINTIAGNGTAGYNEGGGVATNAALNFPSGIAIDSLGNIYFSDKANSCLRKLRPGGGGGYTENYSITTIAGKPKTSGFGGDGGSALQAFLNNPQGIAVDDSGSLYFADTKNSCVRKLRPGGGGGFSDDYSIETIAGKGTFSGYSGNGSDAINSKLNYPEAITIDKNGLIYISDTRNSKLRKLRPGGGGGVISDFAGTGVATFNGDGKSPLQTALNEPVGIAFGNNGSMVVADRANNRLRSIKVKNITKSQNSNKSFNTGLHIYPNPSYKGYFSLELVDGLSRNVQIVITNMLGQNIKNIIITTNTVYNINLEVLSGVYYLQAKDGDEIFVQKIVIIN